MTDEIRLFGVPGAEELWLSIAEAFERQVEPYRDEHDPNHWPAEIEEWTVADNRQFLPSADRILEEIGEIAANEAVTEWWWEALSEQLDDEEVKAGVETVLDLLSSKVTYRMADKHVATYSITLDDNHGPLVDGEPLYQKTEIVDWCSTHDRKMRGVRGTGKWVCDVFYVDETVREGDCVRVDRRRPVEARS